MLLSRSSSAYLGALLSLVIGAARTSRAQEPFDITIIDRGSRELARKLRAEVSYAGFTALDGGARFAEAAATSAGRANTETPATLLIVSAGRVELSVARAGDAARFDSTLVRRPGEGESFALRVVEQLRARLVDVGWTIPSEAASGERPEPAGESDARLARNNASGSSSDASTGESQWDGENASRASGRAPVPAPPADDNGGPASDDAAGAPLRLWLDAGLSASLLRGSRSLTPHATLGGRLDAGADWSASLSSLWPLAGDDLPADAGDAHVRWTGFTLAISHLLPVPAPWLMGAGLGAGLLVLDADGEAHDGFAGQDVRLYSGACFAELDAGRALTSGLRLRAHGSFGLSAPRWVLHSDGSDLLRLGRFFGSLGLAIEVSWPLARADEP